MEIIWFRIGRRGWAFVKAVVTLGLVKCEEFLNRLTPDGPYRGRTAPLTSKRCILYIYSTNIGTEYFKHGIYSPFYFFLQNAVCFVILTYLVPALFTFYIQGVLKLKKNNSDASISFSRWTICVAIVRTRVYGDQ